MRLEFLELVVVYSILLVAFHVLVIALRTLGKGNFVNVWETLLLLCVSMLIGLKVAYSTEKHAKQEFLLKRMLAQEQEKIRSEQRQAQQSLMDLFPLPVRQLLQTEPNPSAATVTSVFSPQVTGSVLVAHLQVEGLDSIPALQMAEAINKYYGYLYERSLQHGIEFIKKNALHDFTACSNPERAGGTEHALSVARFSMCVVEATKKLQERLPGHNITLHLGCSSGSLVAAYWAHRSIHGKVQCSWDIWGEAVDTARDCSKATSRSHGESVQCSEAFRWFLSQHTEFTCEPNGLTIGGRTGSLSLYKLVGMEEATTFTLPSLMDPRQVNTSTIGPTTL